MYENMYQYVSFFVNGNDQTLSGLQHVELVAPVLNPIDRVGTVLNNSERKISVMFVSPEYEKSVREPHALDEPNHTSHAAQNLTVGYKGRPLTEIGNVQISLDAGDLKGTRRFDDKMAALRSTFGNDVVVLYMSEPFIADAALVCKE